MKKIFIYAAVAALAMTAISCQKDKLNENENGLVFTATIDGAMDTKTILTYDRKVNWEAGDEITINGVVYTAAPKSDATKADFTKKNSSDADPAGTFNAFYPAGIQTGATAGGTLPAEQTYAASKITNVPMFATSSTTSLSFKNICAVLAITVKSVDFPSVKSIKVSSSNCALSGAFTVSDGQTATLTSDAQTAKAAVTLDCGTTAVATASGGTVFFIAIPAQTYRNLKIELSADGSDFTEAMTTEEDEDIAVAVNTVYPITFKADAGILLPGKFSVSATKKVQFTRGNLYWDGSAFRCEENQTDYPTGSTWSPSHVGHFYWTKTAAASYAETFSDGDCSAADQFFADGSDASHSLTVEGRNGLYALTKEEWSYLISTRTNAKNLRKRAVTVSKEGIDYTNCFVIAPDNFTGALLDSYTYEEVNASGLVCLPAAGLRDDSSLSDAGSIGYYWSATPYGSNKSSAYYIYFTDSSLNPSYSGHRNGGYAVRLVCTAP